MIMPIANRLAFTQDLQELQRVNQQWQDFSGQVADFDDTLNDQQHRLVRRAGA